MNEFLQINYADGRDGSIRKTSLERIGNARESEIVIFGEGNFTFSVALAALRGRWDGITTTKLEEVNRPDVRDVILECIKYCISNGQQFNVPESTIVNNVKKIVDVNSGFTRMVLMLL